MKRQQKEEKMDNKNYWMLGILVAVLILGLGTLYAVWNQPTVPTAKEIASNVIVPTPSIDTQAIADQVAANLKTNVSTAVSTSSPGDNSRLCDLTNNCNKCFDFNYDNSNLASSKLSNSDYRKLKQAVEEITGLKVKDYEDFSVDLKDTYNYANTCHDGNEGNFNTDNLYRIEYNSVDSHADDSKVIYVDVTSKVRDNIDSDVQNTVKVDRNFYLDK
jgi:hypothetical protein